MMSSTQYIQPLDFIDHLPVGKVSWIKLFKIDPAVSLGRLKQLRICPWPEYWLLVFI